jgi:hypothetical protein
MRVDIRRHKMLQHTLSAVGTDRRCWLSVSSSVIEGRPAVRSVVDGTVDFDPIPTSASLTVDRGSMSHDAASEGSVN